MSSTTPTSNPPPAPVTSSRKLVLLGESAVGRKLVLLGESAVGKSSLVLQFVKQQFDDYRESTIGAAFLTQTVAVQNGFIKFEIWDTAGQERYKSLAPMYYRNAHAAVVVYDITSAPSLQKAKNWIAELQRQADPGITVCLAGNKLDLAESQRQVAYEDAAKFAQEENLLFFETSAKTAEGVVDMFQKIADKLPLDLPSAKARTGGAAAGSARHGVNLNNQAGDTSQGPCAC